MTNLQLQRMSFSHVEMMNLGLGELHSDVTYNKCTWYAQMQTNYWVMALL